MKDPLKNYIDAAPENKVSHSKPGKGLEKIEEKLVLFIVCLMKVKVKYRQVSCSRLNFLILIPKAYQIIESGVDEQEHSIDRVHAGHYLP